MYAETSNANIVAGANATGLPTACDGQELRPGCVVVVHVSLARDLEPGELQRIGDTAVALYKQSGGFQVFYETQVSDRELINISLWNSRSDAERGIQAASSAVRPMLGGLIAAAPVFHFGNVLYAAPPEAF